MTDVTRLLSQGEVCARLKVTRYSVWEWRRQGLFPKPVILGTRSLRWTPESIDQFIAQRVAAR